METGQKIKVNQYAVSLSVSFSVFKYFIESVRKNIVNPILVTFESINIPGFRGHVHPALRKATSPP